MRRDVRVAPGGTGCAMGMVCGFSQEGNRTLDPARPSRCKGIDLGLRCTDREVGKNGLDGEAVCDDEVMTADAWKPRIER